NVCFVNCQFCAFKRQRWEDDAYTHGVDVVLGKVEEAIARGATEVCMQGGINPEMGAFTYRDMLVAIKSRFPEIHVHAFSPMEIMYGARRTNMDYPAYIGMLRDCGLGSIPGTAAEILDDEVREILSHKKVDVRSWVEIITTAHRLGVPTTSTVMYGHVESAGRISREAGADAGEYTSAEEIEALVRAMGRIPVERTTLYGRAGQPHAGHGAGGWRGRGPVPLGPHPAH